MVLTFVRQRNLICFLLIFTTILIWFFYASNNGIPTETIFERFPTMERIVFYNRIPKTASTTFTNAIAYDLAKANGFHVIHVNFTRNRFMPSRISQSLLVKNITSWKSMVPAFYHGHMAYVDFEKFGFSNPIYINVLREPFERFVSYYSFLRFGDNFRVGLKRSRAGNNETFDECFHRKGRDCDPSQLWLQIPYFCGTAHFCAKPGNEMALESAKWNLVNRYLLVGITERLEDTITLLEMLLPDFFHGATKHFQELEESRARLRVTNKKDTPSEAVIKEFKQHQIYKMEREFYDFALREFEFTWERARDKTTGNFLGKQFHYEKILP